MTIEIATKDVTLHESGSFTIEASDLGLPPGTWPEFLFLVDDKGTKELYIRNHLDNMGAEYKTGSGKLLIVWND